MGQICCCASLFESIHILFFPFLKHKCAFQKHLTKLQPFHWMLVGGSNLPLDERIVDHSKNNFQQNNVKIWKCYKDFFHLWTIVYFENKIKKKNLTKFCLGVS